MRVSLSEQAQRWRWSSLFLRLQGEGAMKQVLAVWPVARPGDGVERVNRPQDEKELTGNPAQWGSRSAVWGCPVGAQDGWPVGP